MNTLGKAFLAIAASILGVGVAVAGTGYYASNQGVVVPGGPKTSFGTGVSVLTATVEPGSYLITARIDGMSYAPDSGATCYFTHNGQQAGTQYYTVNTSTPDWSHTVSASTVALNRFTTGTQAVVNLVCSHGYAFSNSAILGGEMTLTPVDAIGP